MIFTFAVGLVLLLQATSALADSASLTVTDASGKSDPAAQVGRTFTVAGATAAPERIFVRYRAVGGAACAPSSDTDSGRRFYDDYPGDFADGDPVNGAFKLSQALTWKASGNYQFCIWIASSSSASVTPITQTIAFRAPSGTVSGTVAPLAPQLGQMVTLTASGATEAPERVYATIRDAGGAACAATYDADSGSGLINGDDVNGAYTLQATTTPTTAGPKLICIWVAASSSDTAPIAGPQPVTFTVSAPPPPCVVPSLSVGTPLANLIASLANAHCTLGQQSYTASRSVPRGGLIKLKSPAGTTLAPQAAVGALLSAGPPCHVPSARPGLKLTAAKAHLKASGCTVGRIRHQSSRRRTGTVVRFSPGTGTRLRPRTAVTIFVSSGRH